MSGGEVTLNILKYSGYKRGTEDLEGDSDSERQRGRRMKQTVAENR